MSTFVVVVIVAVIVAVIAVVVVRRTRRPDGMTAFRRQINALSSEARRPVVDRVHQLEEGVDEVGVGDVDGVRRGDRDGS